MNLEGMHSNQNIPNKRIAEKKLKVMEPFAAIRLDIGTNRIGSFHRRFHRMHWSFAGQVRRRLGLDRMHSRLQKSFPIKPLYPLHGGTKIFQIELVSKNHKMCRLRMEEKRNHNSTM